MLKVLIVLVFIDVYAAVRIKIANLDDTIALVSCAAPGVSQGPHLLYGNKNFYFSEDEHYYQCFTATSNFKFKRWPMDNNTQSDYGWFIQKDGIYSGSFDGDNLQMRYGW